MFLIIMAIYVYAFTNMFLGNTRGSTVGVIAFIIQAVVGFGEHHMVGGSDVMYYIINLFMYVAIAAFIAFFIAQSIKLIKRK